MANMTPAIGVRAVKNRLDAASRLLAAEHGDHDEMTVHAFEWITAQCCVPRSHPGWPQPPRHATPPSAAHVVARIFLGGSSKPVPTLILSSPMDVVVPQKGIYAFGQALTAAQPTRSVRHASISAGHCQLGEKDPQTYASHIGALLDQADSALRSEAPSEPTSDGPTPDVSAGDTDQTLTTTPTTAEALAQGVPSLDAVLHASELSHLSGVLDPAVMSVTRAFALLDVKDRPGLLNALKSAGVAKLTDRQKLCNALSKCYRERK